MNIFTPSKLERNCIVVIGKESTGKSQLIASLTGQSAYSANFRGSTVACETYPSETYTFIDTPGILYRSDSVTTKKAYSFATLVDPVVQGAIAPIIERTAQAPAFDAGDVSLPLSQLPIWLREILIGQYGLITMGPLLFIWAMPTVVLYALFLGAYKASGLVERITITLDPLLRPFGLSGRDLVRVIMGFGCNVPAVISTRACSSCSRGTCISAIAFGYSMVSVLRFD